MANKSKDKHIKDKEIKDKEMRDRERKDKERKEQKKKSTTDQFSKPGLSKTQSKHSSEWRNPSSAAIESFHQKSRKDVISNLSFDNCSKQSSILEYSDTLTEAAIALVNRDSDHSFNNDGPKKVPYVEEINCRDSDVENTKSGYLYKYTVGRGSNLFRNWRRRWFTADHNGLNYSKNEKTVPLSRNLIPFISSIKPELTLARAFLLANVTVDLHPKATNENHFYFGIYFEEQWKPYILLCRAESALERESWVRFLAQFLHWGVQCNGGIPRYPATFSWQNNPNDPDGLSYRGRRKLREFVLAWDEGYQKYRHQGTKVLSLFTSRCSKTSDSKCSVVELTDNQMSIILSDDDEL